MAKKKKTAKSGTRRRTTTRRAAPRRRGRSSRTKGTVAMGMSNPQGLLLAIGGAMLANAYADSPQLVKMIKDDKMRYGAIALGGFLLAKKMPELAPAFIGVGIVGGVKTMSVVFPTLLKPKSGAPYAGNGAAKGADLSHTKAATIGRLTAGEEQRIRDAVRNRGGNMNGMPRLAGMPTLNGVRSGLPFT